jgi:hypothetical protein
MSSGIVMDVDAYGTYARLSATGDWLEKLAINGIQFTEAALADYIGDIGWRFPEIWVGGVLGEPDDTPDDREDDRARRDARAIFAVLEERSELLGSDYPFSVTNRLELSPGSDIRAFPYAALWAVTLCHSYNVATVPNPRQVFEAMVANAVQSNRVATVNFGDLRRRHGNFPKALFAAGEILKMPVDPRAAIRSSFAKDENADMIGHFAWGDMRSGLWSFVGQATCAKSDTWESKMAEVAPPSWMNWLGAAVWPLAFLAVPHHVERKHMARLVETGSRIVLDRLRLARYTGDTTADERTLVESAIDAAYDPP